MFHKWRKFIDKEVCSIQSLNISLKTPLDLNLCDQGHKLFSTKSKTTLRGFLASMKRCDKVAVRSEDRATDTQRCSYLNSQNFKFSYCTTTMLHFFVYLSFHVALSFMLHSLYVLHYFMLHFDKLQCFRFAFFSYCILRKLQFFLVELFLRLHYFQRCSQADPYKHLRWGSFATIINRALNIVAKLSILNARWGPGYASTIFMLHFFNI